MCGFVGFIDKNNIETKKIALENMMNRIIHRGPDSAGTYVDEKSSIRFSSFKYYRFRTWKSAYL